MGIRGDTVMFAYSAESLINQYSIFAVPFIVLVGGVLISRFNFGVRR
jgi:hypothetical protein